MRASRVRLTPEPAADAELCQRGIYRWIRHPMYAGVLLAFGMCALGSGSVTGGALWVALAAVLGTKARIEERLWTRLHPDYAGYARRTKRFLPGIW
jgi:protein-S-isoprenylcysteine O-methyltransferase Ste14